MRFHRFDPASVTAREMERGRINLEKLTITHSFGVTDPRRN